MTKAQSVPVAVAQIPRTGHIATHAAVYSPLTQEGILAPGRKEGWLTRLARRGNFHVVEFWLENAVMLEVLTEELKLEYLATQILAAWQTETAAIASNQPGRPE